MQKIYFIGTNKRIYFYELWQQLNQLKTTEMNEVWPDMFNVEYTDQFQPGTTHKISTISRSTKFKDILPWNVSQLITKTSTRIVKATVENLVCDRWSSIKTVHKEYGDWNRKNK